MSEILKDNSARTILRARKVELDICEPRTAIQVVMDLAMKDVDVAFDVIEATRLNVGYNGHNE